MITKLGIKNNFGLDEWVVNNVWPANWYATTIKELLKYWHYLEDDDVYLYNGSGFCYKIPQNRLYEFYEAIKK